MDVDSEKLEMIYGYMKMYPWFVELQGLGIKLFLSVVDVPNGVGILQTVCEGLNSHLVAYEELNSVKDDIKRLREKIQQKEVDLLKLLRRKGNV